VILLEFACGGSTTASQPVAPSQSEAVVILTVTGTSSLALGQTSQLTATATLSTGTKRSVTASWQSSNPQIASVSDSGLVTAIGPGASTISAGYESKTATLGISVSGNGEIVGCGTFTGVGPFTVATDLKGSTFCLRFSDSASAQLDCQGHDVSSLSLSNVQGFTLRNCALQAGENRTLQVLDSVNVTIDSADVLGGVYLRACVGCTLSHSRFIFPVRPPDPSGTFVSSEVFLIDGRNNRIIQNTIDGGWDGNVGSTYQAQGCDDGLLLDANDVVQGNTIRNAFDAAIESSTSVVPLTVTIRDNTIAHMGFTGIGGYYVPGWQDSVFSGNTVSDSPSLLYFDGSGAKQASLTSLTLVNNRFEGNTLLNPVRLPQKYGGAFTPAMTVNYVTAGLPFEVSDNVLRSNNFGMSTAGPALAPATGFVDGGGNVCLPGGTLKCGAGGSMTFEAPSPTSQASRLMASRVVDHFEEISVHGLAKEDALERRRPERLDDLGAQVAQLLPERGEPIDGMVQGDVPAELALERRHLKTVDEHDVQLLAAAEAEPRTLVRHVLRHRIAAEAERLLEERRRSLDLLRAERHVGKAARHALRCYRNQRCAACYSPASGG